MMSPACDCPPESRHEPGCPVERAALRVREALRGPPVPIFPQDESPDPNQILHALQGRLEDVAGLALVWRDGAGVWRADWAGATPGELLEAALALRLAAEDAWEEIQAQTAGEDPEG